MITELLYAYSTQNYHATENYHDHASQPASSPCGHAALRSREPPPVEAVRPASGRTASPDLPMIWVQAATVADLADRMRAADAQLAP